MKRGRYKPKTERDDVLPVKKRKPRSDHRDWIVKLPDQEDLGDGGFRAGHRHLLEEEPVYEEQ